jgi:hypothetical protein
MCFVPLLQLQNRYGDVFSLQMAWKPMVVINRMKAMKEVLLTCGEDTADRPPVPIFEHLGFKPRSQGKGLCGWWIWVQTCGNKLRKHRL